MTPSSRRVLLACLAGSGLAGCGFRPLYMRAASGGPGSAQRELDRVSVDAIPDRPGQLLREALLQRFYGGEGAAAPSYTLHVDYSIAGEGIGIQPDNTTTRIRFIARAKYVLTSQESPPATLTSGTARSVDAENIVENQLFAADLENEAAQRRLAGAVADQVATQLAVFFKKRALGGAA